MTGSAGARLTSRKGRACAEAVVRNAALARPLIPCAAFDPAKSSGRVLRPRDRGGEMDWLCQRDPDMPERCVFVIVRFTVAPAGSICNER